MLPDTKWDRILAESAGLAETGSESFVSPDQAATIDENSQMHLARYVTFYAPRLRNAYSVTPASSAPSCGPARTPVPLPLAPPLHMNCPPYPCIQFHCVHASGVPQNTRLSTAPNLTRHPLNAPVVCGTKMRRWSTFTPPRHAAIAARCGLFLLRRSYQPN